MHQQTLALRHEKEKEQAVKLKKQLAKKLAYLLICLFALRDTISPDEYYFIIENIQGKG